MAHLNSFECLSFLPDDDDGCWHQMLFTLPFMRVVLHIQMFTFREKSTAGYPDLRQNFQE
jgi:hypothetical protein